MNRNTAFTIAVAGLALLAIAGNAQAIGFTDVSLSKDVSGTSAHLRLWYGTTQNTSGKTVRYKFVFTVKYGVEVLKNEHYSTLPHNGRLVAKDTCYRFHVTRPSGGAKSGTVTAVAYREGENGKWYREASTSKSFTIAGR